MIVQMNNKYFLILNEAESMDLKLKGVHIFPGTEATGGRPFAKLNTFKHDQIDPKLLNREDVKFSYTLRGKDLYLWEVKS